MSEPAPAVFDVVLFYKYTDIVDPSAVIAYLEALCGPDGLNLIGRVLIANEGVNGTLAGPHIVNPAGMTVCSVPMKKSCC